MTGDVLPCCADDHPFQFATYGKNGCRNETGRELETKKAEAESSGLFIQGIRRSITMQLRMRRSSAEYRRIKTAVGKT
jgi:hypothetical protein